VIFQLNASETADWQECWCFQCVKDHHFSHLGDAEDGDGCPVLLPMLTGDDAPHFRPHDKEWFCFIPAEVSCSEFEPCTECPPERSDAERRGGETRRGFHARLREETLAKPIYDQEQQR